ncbi:MAG: 50S ribosomal protein L29 [Phycisphaerales bacterium]|nr:50S ribosomal protein L29 [Phycisphaerales bacterium]
MTGAEVRKMTSEEIGLEMKRLQDKLFTLRSQAVTEKVEDNSQYGKVRKDIARLKTEQSARLVKK